MPVDKFQVDHDRTMQVLGEALDLAPELRAAFLHEACGDDGALHDEVGHLLSGEHVAQRMMATGKLVPIDHDLPELESIGPYRVIKRLGQGGMGRVYLAEQESPIRRTVALKLIRPGLDSDEVIARFRSERQALARMNHPSVARVFDAGTTDRDRPYFVMEYVEDGQPITTYCDGRRLTITQRLELFQQVCRAVQHAHQKGIIHRDLKPANILVAPQGKTGALPKVIDFGIAKATESNQRDEWQNTRHGQVIGTPEYMSPEQADASIGADIDTRSDVYSLGVLLYELLTGTTPFDENLLKQTAMDEVRRIVREEDPPRPSTRLSTMGEAVTAISAQRQTDSKRLNRVLRGELDWIVMKALEKDRNRRYESADALANDVQHYLADEPVEACPPSKTYQFWKFVRRNRGLVVAVAVILLLLAGGVTATAWQVVRADRERAIAIRERNEKQTALEAETAANEQAMWALRSLTDDVVGWQLVRSDTPSGSGRVFLDKIVSQFEAFAAIKGNTPESRFIRAEGSLRVGFLRARRKERDEARACYENALEMFQRLAEESPTAPDYRRYLALSHVALGTLFRDSGKLEEAGVEMNRAAAIRSNLELVGHVLPDYRRHLIADHHSIRRLLLLAGRPADAEVEERQALALSQQLVAEFPGKSDYIIELGYCYSNVGDLVFERGDNAASVELYAHANRILAPVVEQSPQSTSARLYLGRNYFYRAMTLEDLGRFAEALPDWQHAMEMNEGTRRGEHGIRWAVCLARLEPAKAIAATNKFIRRDPNKLEKLFEHAAILAFAGDTEGYQRLCRELLDRRDTLKCTDLPGRRMYLLARLCLLSPDAVADPAQPTQLADQALRELPSSAYYLHALGLAHYRTGRYIQAAQRLNESMRADPAWTGQPANWLVLAMVHQRTGNPDEARRWLDKAVVAIENHYQPQRTMGLGMHMHDWLACLLLRREAEAMMAAK